ncbi:uncharacterized protein LOC135161821 [Diachasmimorpha longicaudata]|uniref:uncharacterized protein LOC135161821 n=1 Tax=Diachasmimorpha longicaudata TaxID=58733 RepID=UPI0030B8AD4C
MAPCICTMLIHRDQARELHQILEEYFMTAIENKRVTNLLLTGISTVRGLCWILIPTIFVMMGIYTATPIWNVLIQKRHHIEPVTYSLIYPGIYPWNISNGTIYRIHYTIETFASITIFSVSCGIDALFAYYVFLMIGQLRMMGYKLTRLDEQKNIEIVVKECVREYEVLLRCRNSVEDIFGPIILWMIGTTAVVQCALIFQLFQVKILILVFYYVSILLQIPMPSVGSKNRHSIIFQNARNITIARWILIVSHLIPKVTQTYIYSWSGSCLIAEVKRKLFHLLFWNAKWNLFTLNHLD